MKKITLILFALFAASSMFLTSCFEKAAVTLPNVTLGYNSPSTVQVITKTNAAGAFSMAPTQIHLNMDSILKANSITGSLKSIIINNIKFEIVSGAANFDFLQFVTSNLTITGGPSQNFSSANPIPKGSASFLIDGNNFDINPYVNLKDFTFSYGGNTLTPIAQDVTVKITLGFTITASGS